MMACGAHYASEHSTGASLHAAAMQLILEVRRHVHLAADKTL